MKANAYCCKCSMMSEVKRIALNELARQYKHTVTPPGKGKLWQPRRKFLVELTDGSKAIVFCNECKRDDQLEIIPENPQPGEDFKIICRIGGNQLNVKCRQT